MTTKKDIFEESFIKYVPQERESVSLRGFHAAFPDVILKNSKKREDNKRIWGRCFRKAVSDLNVKDYTSERPDWEEIERQISENNDNEKAEVSSKRGWEEPAPASSTPVSSTAESTNKRRKKMTMYLALNSAPVVVLEDGIEKWRVNEVEVSEALLEYRKLSIEKCGRTLLDTYQEELSINGIFLFDDRNSIYPDSALEYGFDDSTWAALINQCRNEHPLTVLSDKTETIINKVAKAARNNYNQCSRIIKELSDDEDENNNNIYESLNSIIKLYSPKSSMKSDQLESTFSISAVYPLVLSFLDETHLLTRKGTDKKAPRKSDYGNKKSYLVTDLSINFEYGSMPSEGLLLVEIKSPQKVLNGSRPGLIKLANEMKDSLDKMIEDQIDDPQITVLGILIEGFRCTLFIMDLKYQGIYRLIPLSIFYIPRDRNDFYVLLNCYEALCTLQNMLSKNAQLCFNFHRKKKRESIRSKYTIQSCRLDLKQSTSTRTEQ